MRELKHKILLALSALTIIGEVASIFLWTTNRYVGGEPYARFSLAVSLQNCGCKRSSLCRTEFFGIDLEWRFKSGFQD
jgi:hypothetical protein